MNEFLKRFLEKHPLMGIEAEMPVLGETSGLPLPEWVQEGPIYEIFVRQFSESGSLTAVQEKLPDLQDLGVKTLWLMPIHPIGKKDRKGTLGSPYAIADYMTVDPALGTKEDLKMLVHDVHRRDMRLILDLVVNHTANDHPWHKHHPGFYLYPHLNNEVRKAAEWSDITDLDYDKKELRKKISAMMRYWVEGFDIDGYRCDVAGLVPLDFWENTVGELLKIKPGLFMLAEWQSSRLHTKAFHAWYDWVLYWLLRDVRTGKSRPDMIPAWLEERRKLFPARSTALQFTENHDYPRSAQIYSEQAFRPFAALTFLLPGLPLLYAGQEYGTAHMPSLFEKQPIDRQNHKEEIHSFYKRMTGLYRSRPALKQGKVTFLKTENKNVLILKCGAGDRFLYGLLNFSGQVQSVYCAELADMVGTDLLSGQLFDGSDISLDSWQVLIPDLVEDDLLMI